MFTFRAFELDAEGEGEPARAVMIDLSDFQLNEVTEERLGAR